MGETLKVLSEWINTENITLEHDPAILDEQMAGLCHGSASLKVLSERSHFSRMNCFCFYDVLVFWIDIT